MFGIARLRKPDQRTGLRIMRHFLAAPKRRPDGGDAVGRPARAPTMPGAGLCRQESASNPAPTGVSGAFRAPPQAKTGAGLCALLHISRTMLTNYQTDSLHFGDCPSYVRQRHRPLK